MPLRDMLRVLVVDDMSTSRGILLQALDTLGIGNVSYAENGRTGMLHAREKVPHLVLTQKVGFILIAGRGDATVIETGQRLGMNNFLTKPFTAAQLKSCIEAVVGRL